MTKRGGVLFWIGAVFLLLFRAKWAFEPQWSSDEGFYLQHLYDWVGLTTPVPPPLANPVAVGTSLVWLIPALLGRLAAAVSGTAPEAWILPLIGLTSMACWGIGFAFLDGALGTLRARDILPRRGLGTVALVLTIPVLYYCTSRTMMSHAAEFALSMAVLYFMRKGRLVWALGAALFLAVTRYNDAPALLLPLAGFFERARVPGGKSRLALGIGMACVVAASAWFALVHGYSSFTVLDLFTAYTWDGVWDVLSGWNFGLLWTALPWLGSLAFGFAFFGRLSRVGRAAVVWVAAEAVLIGGWTGNGSDFGYRYIIGSYAACFLIWFELFECGALHDGAKRAFRALVIAQAAFLTLLLVIFKTLPGSGMGDSSNGGRGSPIIPHLLSVPFEPKFFKVVLVQQFPPVSVFISLFMGDRPGYSYYAVHGPALLLLGAATAISLVFVGLGALSDSSTC